MKTVLVVEDDKLLGKAVSGALEEAGYKALWSKDGKQAFEALEAQEIQMVYLDIMLPGEVDGYEILRRIKGEDKWKSIPVVMLSNLGQMKEIDRAMELGAADYIVKANIDLSRLIEVTRSKLGGS